MVIIFFPYFHKYTMFYEYTSVYLYDHVRAQIFIKLLLKSVLTSYTRYRCFRRREGIIIAIWYILHVQKNKYRNKDFRWLIIRLNEIYTKIQSVSRAQFVSSLTRRHPSWLINLERPYFAIIQSNLFASQKDDTSPLVSLVSLRETASCRNPSWWSRSCGWILRGRVKRDRQPFTKKNIRPRVTDISYGNNLPWHR